MITSRRITWLEVRQESIIEIQKKIEKQNSNARVVCCPPLWSSVIVVIGYWPLWPINCPPLWPLVGWQTSSNWGKK